MGAALSMITSGKNGKLWITSNEGSTSSLWSVDTQGTLVPGSSPVFYDVPTAASAPNGIAIGPDGDVWFTEYAGNKIGHFRPSIEGL